MLHPLRTSPIRLAALALATSLVGALLLPGAGFPQAVDRAFDPARHTTFHDPRAYCDHRIEEFSVGKETFHWIVAAEDGCVLEFRSSFDVPGAVDEESSGRHWVDIPPGVEAGEAVQGHEVITSSSVWTMMRDDQTEHHGPIKVRILSWAGRSVTAEIVFRDFTSILAFRRWFSAPDELYVSLSGLAPEVQPPGVSVPRLADEAKLTAPDAHEADLFGLAVAVDGDTAVVGAPGDDDSAAPRVETGAAYVLMAGAAGWSLQEKLLPHLSSGGARFGSAVDIDGDTAVIGAPADDSLARNAGSAHVFVRHGGEWSPAARLLPVDGAADALFGNAVAISGDTIVVGAHGDATAGPWTGAAEVGARGRAARPRRVWQDDAMLPTS